MREKSWFSMSLENDIQQAAELLRASRRTVVLTGAGISKESGVPTFRDALDGLWARYDPMRLATPEAFRRDPRLVWEFYEYRRSIMRPARPNPGHLALAALERALPAFCIITQNVDDLHEQAGSQQIIRLHGSINANKCFAACRGEPTAIDLHELQAAPDALPPTCPYCGGFVRPAVVWFGEALPADALRAAIEASAAADVMLIVGTSGVVQPAADLPIYAAQRGARLIEINPTRSELTPLVDRWLVGPSGVILPQIAAALGVYA